MKVAPQFHQASNLSSNSTTTTTTVKLRKICCFAINIHSTTNKTTVTRTFLADSLR
jgi:hypothetical protein